MSALKKLQTGVPGLDILTFGGIPQGRSTLIAGKSGTGKTVVGLQIATNLARQGVPTIVLAVEETPEDLLDSGDFMKLVDEHVADRNNHLAKYETIKKYRIVRREFSKETGELTATLKVKRKVCPQRYKDIIEGMYAE